MSQSRKQKIQDNVKQRRNKRIRNTIIVLGVVAIIISAVYVVTRPAGSGFPFPCLGFEGTTLHVHPWLQILVKGQKVAIPGSIGIVSSLTGTCFEPMHTHDASGIIHIESDNTTTPYTLGDFFTIWNDTYGTVNVFGVQRPIVFNETDILGFKNDSTHQVKLLVDGTVNAQFGLLNLVPLDYCNSVNASVPPCRPTAPGLPQYRGGYPFGTNHTVQIQY